MDAGAGAIEPVFGREPGGSWQPHAEANGPFGGLHGGAVSGLVIAEMEREARARGLGTALSASVLLLRPAPLAALETRTELLRAGERVGALETVLLAQGKLIAKATGSFVLPQRAVSTPAQPPRPFDPTALPRWRTPRVFAHKTLFDAQDIRDDGNGTKWARLIRPLVGFDAPLATVFAIADNATAFYLTARQIEPRWAFPNIDISVHLSRPPEGEWIGVAAQSDWRESGMGLTESTLYDRQGDLGRACQTVVLITPS
jgi:acyl-Coa thioesterase superfamily protein/acyl-CoA thioesterase superfamily protein